MEPSKIRYADLSKDNKAILKTNEVTNHMFNQRMKTGWELYDAIHLPNTFRLIDGEIKRSISINDEIYYMYPHHDFKMKFYKLDTQDVVKRIKNGATMEQATSVVNSDSSFDKGRVAKKARVNKINYAQLLFEQSCKQFLEDK